MATITLNHTFSSGGTIFASEHNTNFSTIYNEFNGGITNDNISASAAIVDTKLAQITTASKVHGSSLTNLDSVPSGAGALPIANLDLATDGSIYIGDGTAPPTTLDAFTSSTGTLKHENGGVEADISAVAKGGLVAGSGAGSMALLTVGSDDQLLTAASGEATGLKYTTPAMKLLSTTSATGFNTGDITIAASKQYYVTATITATSGGNVVLGMRFNSDSTGTSYAWAKRQQVMETTSTETNTGDDSDDDIQVCSYEDLCKLEFYIDTYSHDSHSAFVRGTAIHQVFDDTGGFAMTTFSGIVLVNITVTSFELYDPASTAGTVFDVKVYEVAQS